jgi:hypothetical protein
MLDLNGEKFRKRKKHTHSASAILVGVANEMWVAAHVQVVQSRVESAPLAKYTAGRMKR